MFTARLYANALGKEVKLTFLASSGWILLLWMTYPICWGVSEGGNVIHPDSEFIFYGILDCCLIPMGSAVLLWGHRNIDPRRLGLYMREYDDPVPGYNSVMYDEKARAAVESGVQPGATNGVTDPATSAAV
jgi:bacteriorhodopsin